MGPSDQLTLVFSSRDMARFMVARSLLEDAGIACMPRNELLQQLFGRGTRRATRGDLFLGELELYVFRDNEVEALGLLGEAFGNGKKKDSAATET